MSVFKVQPLKGYTRFPEEKMLEKSIRFLEQMGNRRTVREFSNKPVDRQIIENCIKTAATAPSGDNCQPWHFTVVSDPGTKGVIRKEAEKVERRFYSSDGPKKWVKDLEHLGTNSSKPFLEMAPYLIAVFAQLCDYDDKGDKISHYYVMESVGIATGILISALHLSGFATLTYTPVNMRFLNRVLKRPSNEKPFMILAAGYPEKNVQVPVISKKPTLEIMNFI